MTSRGRDMLVGLTAILGAIGLAIMLLLFGEFSIGAPDRYNITAHMSSAGGVGRGTTVLLNGVAVGVVGEVRTQDDPRDGVIVELRINDGVRIPKDALVSVERSLIGEPALALKALRKDSRESGFLNPGDVIQGEGGSMLDQISTLLDSRLASLDRAADEVARLARSFGDVGDRARALVEPRTVEDVAAGAEPNISSAIDRLDRAVASAETWLSDESFRSDLKELVQRGNETVGQAQEAFDSLSRSATAVTAEVERFGADGSMALRNFAHSAQMLGEAVTEIQALALKINQGEGTFGQLANNPDLYNSLVDAARRLEKALLEAQLLVEKYRKEGIPINW